MRKVLNVSRKDPVEKRFCVKLCASRISFRKARPCSPIERVPGNQRRMALVVMNTGKSWPGNPPGHPLEEIVGEFTSQSPMNTGFTANGATAP